MPAGEFDLIRRFFLEPSAKRAGGTVLGIGDDCALLDCPEGTELAVTVDTLVSGIHFFPDVDPARLGHKALAVNLSDLAAMGAKPAWCTLAVTLPEVEESWLSAFSRGFFALANRFGVALVGGDTTRGPLSITIQAMGLVPVGQALRRSGARPGDLIYVSGPLGGAGLGLKMLQGLTTDFDAAAIDALECPEPRVALGERLRGLASACIDISDGLAADLGHLLAASQVGATLDVEHIPLIESVRQFVRDNQDSDLPLTAGDDYELCFTVPIDRQAKVDSLLERLELPGQCVGAIETTPGLRIQRHGQPIALKLSGYDHFSQR
jgi:thiamine-monophosphate kinase